MRMTLMRFLASTASILVLSGCGGGGGSTSFIPAPPVTLTPTPTPTPATPGPAVPAAVQTAAPTSPTAGTTKFSTLAQSTDFPLLMTAAGGGTGDGDQATTVAGGVLNADGSGGYFLTMNNPALGINKAVIPNARPISGSIFYVNADIGSNDLDYTRFGSWERTDGIDGVFNVGAWTTGFATAGAQIPGQGTATYAGKASGLYNAAISSSSTADFDSRITGDVNLTADFGRSTLAGTITNIVASSMYTNLKGSVNDIGFSATIDRNNNLFNGTTMVTSFPADGYAFGPTASGLINGRFYGPNAAEVGAVFNVSEGTRRLIGSFGAKH